MTKLSNQERARGVEVLVQLQTVQRAFVREDTTAIPLIAGNVVNNEQQRVIYSDYIKNVLGPQSTMAEQQKLVAELLPDCFELNEEQAKALHKLEPALAG